MKKIKEYLNNKDRLSSIVCALFSIWLWVEAGKLPRSRFDQVGPKVYPRFLATLILISAIALFFTAKKDKPVFKKDDAAYEDEAQKAYAKKEQKSNTLKFLAAVIDFIVYFESFKYLGFILASIVFLMVFVLLFDKRPMKLRAMHGLVFSVVFTGILYLLFGKLLGVLLPTLII